MAGGSPLKRLPSSVQPWFHCSELVRRGASTHPKGYPTSPRILTLDHSSIQSLNQFTISALIPSQIASFYGEYTRSIYLRERRLIPHSTRWADVLQKGALLQ